MMSFCRFGVGRGLKSRRDVVQPRLDDLE